MPPAHHRERAISDEEKAEFVEDALNCAALNHLRERGSGFAQRVWPLLDMMRRADWQQADIVWGFQGGTVPRNRWGPHLSGNVAFEAHKITICHLMIYMKIIGAMRITPTYVRYR